MDKAETLFQLAQALSKEHLEFMSVKGPGIGDKATHSFMNELRQRTKNVLGSDYSEQKICGTNGFCVDFYFPEEATIVEIAFSLRNPSSEYERDVLKALIARENDHQVSRLVFISKPGAAKRLEQPGAKAVAAWAKQKYGLDIIVWELQK